MIEKTDQIRKEWGEMMSRCSLRLQRQWLAALAERREADMQLLGERMVAQRPKTCLSCGSATQPCCGH